jgi:AcrR family transcriptional regulator
MTITGPAAEATTRTRREIRAEDTRRKITGAAIELVHEVGWRDATVERIAAKAGVAKGTFFIHFANKEALVEALVGIQVNAAKRARARAVTKPAPERLRETVLTLGRHAGASVELSRAVLVATMQNADVARVVDEMFLGVHEEMIADAAEIVGETRAESLANLLMACYLGAALHVTTSRRAGQLEDVLAPLVDATLAAHTEPKKNGMKR